MLCVRVHLEQLLEGQVAVMAAHEALYLPENKTAPDWRWNMPQAHKHAALSTCGCTTINLSHLSKRQLAPETGCHRCIFAAPQTRTLRASYSTREPDAYWVVLCQLFEARPKSRSRTSARMLARASCSASNASCSRNSASCRAACDMARSVTGAALSERARL